MKLAIFTDYDGTITVEDTVDLMLNTYGMPDWLEISKELDAAGAKNIERMEAEFKGFRATRQQVVDLVRENVHIDQTFRELVDLSGKRGWRLVVLSQGFRESVEAVFDKYGITGVEWYANAFEEKDGSLVPAYPDKDLIVDGECTGFCGVCKGGHIRKARREGYTTVYIGDGITDRCAAERADTVFAKRYLRKYLAEKGRPFTPFEEFSDVAAELSKRFPESA